MSATTCRPPSRLGTIWWSPTTWSRRAATARSSAVWRGPRGRRPARARSRWSPTAATTADRRCWPASRPASRRMCRRPITSNAVADGRFGKDDFVYDAVERQLSLSSRRGAHASLYVRRERHAHPRLLGERLRNLFNEDGLHHRQGAARAPLGARARAGSDGSSDSRGGRS